MELCITSFTDILWLAPPFCGNHFLLWPLFYGLHPLVRPLFFGCAHCPMPEFHKYAVAQKCWGPWKKICFTAIPSLFLTSGRQKCFWIWQSHLAGRITVDYLGCWFYVMSRCMPETISNGWCRTFSIQKLCQLKVYVSHQHSLFRRTVNTFCLSEAFPFIAKGKYYTHAAISDFYSLCVYVRETECVHIIWRGPSVKCSECRFFTALQVQITPWTDF